MSTPFEKYKPNEITLLISQASQGDVGALDDLMPIIYPDLKRIASGIRHKQFVVSKTLNTTSLVNEAWLKLAKYGIKAESRKHFYCIVAQAMRQILVNAAKDKLYLKRNAEQMTLDASHLGTDSDALMMIQIDEIVETIEETNKRLAEVFQLKYFLGFSEIEISETLNINVRTVRRDWFTVRKIIQEIIQ